MINTIKTIVYSLICLLFSCGNKPNSNSYENCIQMEILSYERNEKSEGILKIEISNISTNDLWFDPRYITITSIYDKKGEEINNFNKLKICPFEVPNFVLIKGISKTEILRSFDNSHNYKYILEKGKRYIAKFEYSNEYSKKKDKKIKTFTGKIINMKSFEFVY